MAKRWLWATLSYLGMGALVAASLVVWWQTPTQPFHMAARLAALWGYNALFLAILTAELARQARRLLGTPFLRAHHFLALGGLALIVAHPAVMVLGGESPSIFVPRLETAMVALQQGGRIALYLFLAGALAAWLRNRLGFWRLVHFLNYAALLLACFHGLSLGTDLQGGPLRILWPLMAAGAVAIFVHRRLRARAGS